MLLIIHGPTTCPLLPSRERRRRRAEKEGILSPPSHSSAPFTISSGPS